MKKIIDLSKVLVCIFLLLMACSSTVAQLSPSQSPVATGYNDTGSFYLLIYGEGLDEGQLQLSLKTNPSYGERWEPADERAVWDSCNDRMIMVGLFGRALYMGQDIRENYIAMRIESEAKEDILISAVYALSPAVYATHGGLENMEELIEESPHELKELSLASHIRPRPYILKPGESWTEHIEAGVKHYKPGIREVEWLDIIFSRSF